MRSLFLVAVLLSTFLPAAAQTNNLLPKFNYQGLDYSGFMVRTLQYPKVLKEACWTQNALVTATFQINEKGKLASLLVEGTVSDSIRQYVQSVFAKTSGHWAVTTAGGKPAKSKVFVQPIVFHLISGCGTMKDYQQALQLLDKVSQNRQIMLGMIWVGSFADMPEIRDTTRGMPFK